MNSRIGFNKPYFTGKELDYIREAVESGKISGDGIFTKKCHRFFQDAYGFHRLFLTTSCTDALEMAALLLNVQPGDEIIMPSFTFVSTANAFVLRGAQIVFIDSEKDTPNVDALLIEEQITPQTKAIVVVHYAGIACDLGRIVEIARKHRVVVVEDAAQAIDSYYKGIPLGKMGNFGAFSFHESKNIISGEGGMLAVNDPEYVSRAEIMWEKGTNRAAFFRGEVDKYTWFDVGSSFLPSDVMAAILYAQLENLEKIQTRRKEIWKVYYDGLQYLQQKGCIRLPVIPDYATNNAHMFFVLCSDLHTRTRLVSHLRSQNIDAVFHYLPLHASPYYKNKNKHKEKQLPNSERYSDCLLRLPLYYELTNDQVCRVVDCIDHFYRMQI